MFSFVRSNGGHNFPAIVDRPTTASTSYKVGDALALSGGALVLATGETAPAFICAETYDAPASGQKNIGVYPVYDFQEWKTTFAAAATALNVGDKVTIHTDGEQVTATKTNGVAEIVEILDAAIGGSVIVKF